MGRLGGSGAMFFDDLGAVLVFSLSWFFPKTSLVPQGLLARGTRSGAALRTEAVARGATCSASPSARRKSASPLWLPSLALVSWCRRRDNALHPHPRE